MRWRHPKSTCSSFLPSVCQARINLFWTPECDPDLRVQEMKAGRPALAVVAGNRAPSTADTIEPPNDRQRTGPATLHGVQQESFASLNRIATAMWKELSVEARRPFQAMAEADKVRYKKEVERFCTVQL